MNRVKPQGKERKEIVLEALERVWVAADTHKRSYHVAVYSDQRGMLATWVQPARAEVLVRRLEPIAAHVVQVVYEAGPNGFGLARALKSAGFAVLVAAPSRIPSAPGRQNKTDRLDCRKLAVLAAKGMLQAVHVPEEGEEADRQVMRRRGQVVDKLKQAKHQIKSFLLCYGIAEPPGLKNWTQAGVRALREVALADELRWCLEDMLDELEVLQTRLRRINAKVRELSRSPRHREAVAVLTSAPSVGLITAMTWRTEVLAPERFTAEELASHLGLAPSVYQTGNTRRGGPIIKAGNRRVRAMMVEAAWRWIRIDPWARACYARLVGNTGDSRKAIVGLARRLALRLWAMTLRGERYRPAAA